ncbi:MAG: Gfo/Idh/MocA family oxidoreductase [Gemmataceae bacterium]|nr:Gfo/Idh/MocA family oxidoreductase [Gemmataceae bacterium]MCS7269956.1 Gfo/Idh/MocA family oxidoreductase [Gemmataceae bacterium]MDW8241602.1 Gfo/Idh/MocA family oxidoreductase [Thermogemmata sp.]
MVRRFSRREVLAVSAAGLGYLYTAPAFSAERIQGANERLRVAGIGVGGKGSSDIDQAARYMEVVALCDIDERPLGEKAKKWPQAKTFHDYRKLFDDSALLRVIDAVVVSTPDHTHALPSILAMRAGKHVYCQKPLTHDVYEAHLMREEARKNKVCTQMGNQGTAANGLRRAVELIRAGELGDVTEVHVWTNRPIWPQAPKITDKNPPKPAPVPAGVHWDEFLGPAPERPYAQGIHPFGWRGFWDFGTGAIGDMACHTANMAFMALELEHPIHVSAEAGDVNPLTCPSYAHVVLKFPARGNRPPVTVHWYEGQKNGVKLLPPEELVKKAVELAGKSRLVDSGSILVGTKGLAYSPNDYGAEVYFSTGKKTNGMTPPEKLPVNNENDVGQKREWVEAIKAGKPELALANFDYAALLTAAFLLGNVAIRVGKGFTWDGVKCQAVDCPEAAQYVRRTYRKGWDLIGYNA